MTPEQKQRAAELLAAWRATTYALHADSMADLLQELADAPEAEPVLVVETEPGYWNRGHYCEGTKSYIDPTKVWGLPVGTKLYTAPPAPIVPDEIPDAVIDAVADAIGGAYDCLRVWSAWGYGTMGPDDFLPVTDDAERVAEIARAALSSWLSAAPTPAEAPADVVRDAVAAEREACAKLCDEQHDRARTSTGAYRANSCAVAIRARGEKGQS